MFLIIVVILLLIAFLLALRSLKTLNEKPLIKHIKKNLDKNRIIFHSHSSK